MSTKEQYASAISRGEAAVEAGQKIDPADRRLIAKKANQPRFGDELAQRAQDLLKPS